MRDLKKATETATMQRRQFLIGSSKVLLVLPAGWVLANCSNSTTPATNVGAATLTYTSSTTAAHTHDFTIAMAEVDNPPSAGISRDTSVTLAHTHVVTLTSAQLAQIAAGQVVTMDTSLTEGHLHTFTFSLAAASTNGAAGSGGTGGSGGAGGTGGSGGSKGTAGSNTGTAGAKTTNPTGGY